MSKRRVNLGILSIVIVKSGEFSFWYFRPSMALRRIFGSYFALG